MTFIENIKDNNQFPIIFIGFGITKRYFKKSPNWEGLLQDIWNEFLEPNNYFTKYHQYEDRFGSDKTFEINTTLASYLEEKYNDAFYEQKVKLPNLSLQKAHVYKINPFKQRIANIFSNLQKKKVMMKRKNHLVKCLLKQGWF